MTRRVHVLQRWLLHNDGLKRNRIFFQQTEKRFDDRLENVFDSPSLHYRRVYERLWMIAGVDSFHVEPLERIDCVTITTMMMMDRHHARYHSPSFHLHIMYCIPILNAKRNRKALRKRLKAMKI